MRTRQIKGKKVQQRTIAHTVVVHSAFPYTILCTRMLTNLLKRRAHRICSVVQSEKGAHLRLFESTNHCAFEFIASETSGLCYSYEKISRNLAQLTLAYWRSEQLIACSCCYPDRTLSSFVVEISTKHHKPLRPKPFNQQVKTLFNFIPKQQKLNYCNS